MSLLRSFVVCSVLFAPAFGQELEDKRPLDHADYDKWNTMRQRSISNDGKWIMFSYANGKGQSTLKIRHTSSAKEYTVKNASSGRFTFDSSKALFVVTADPEVAKKLRKEKKSDDIPKPKLQILALESGETTTIEGVSSFSLPRENSDWITFRAKRESSGGAVRKGTSEETATYEVTPEGLKRKRDDVSGRALAPGNEDQAKKEKPESKKKAKPKKDKTEGSPLVVRNLTTQLERRFPYVTSSAFTKDGKKLAFATASKDGEADGVWVLTLADEKATQVLSGLGNYRSLSFSDDGNMLAFMSDRDDYAAEKPSWSLYLLSKFRKEAAKVAMAGDEGIPKGWWIASSSGPAFSEDGRRLFFSTAPIPEEVTNPKKDDEEPKAKLDLWHWKDPQLQPQQLLQAARERNRSYRAVYDIRAKKILQLATKEIPTVSIDFRSKADQAVGSSNEKYKKMLSWDTPGFSDIYLIDLKTGKSELVAEKIRARASMSPSGKYLAWFDPEKLAWFAMSTKAKEPIEISKGAEVSFANELHDTPSLPRSYRTAGWLDKDAAVLVYDRFDIWKMDPTGKEEPVKLTDGREAKLRHRGLWLDPEERTINPENPIMLSLFNEKTKATGFASMKIGGEVTTHMMLDESLGSLSKAKNADNVMFTRSTFRKCPDIWSSTTAFKKIGRVSRINPQQTEYLWGTAELVSWNSKDDQPLDGILYKPDGFDAKKKYPLMVYYYERNSDNLHSYHTPAAGRSIINFSFYVSRGYCVFIPDIPYTTGFPGESAAKAVLPGVEHILAMGFIDKERVGMQGHSWGGYQAAYLVTQTDMFACAESGAPVSNMTSAYGGIRWGSGMSRMFQYERTQSRIGVNLWEGRDKYIANSPVFFADKINTPLLILHNDQDGAVPWYQGIELFVAMRRLGKKAWMMNYNGEPHWVMKPENRIDFAKRMQQFFDPLPQGRSGTRVDGQRNSGRRQGQEIRL